ncbi:polyisoprenyl-teichoic acid--peptidoglycan teichoic acid transferase TagV [Lachnospiraceae bacterium]|nr:polyisoprenyl-teichoic acid--peptidoglycan teichoic acid transferase TagV [Lachnospiraceae bacterium]
MKRFRALICVGILMLFWGIVVFARGTEDDRYTNILCLGVDKEEQMSEVSAETGSIGQSDAIFLVSLDKIENRLRVISIPRDTMVTLEMYDVAGEYVGQSKGQLTLQYAYGDGEGLSCRLMKEQVEGILGIDIDGCVAVNFKALKGVTDLLGGVPVYMDEDYTYIRPEFAQGETVNLSADLAHDFCRARIITEDGSAYRRIHRLQVFMSSALSRGKSVLAENPMWLFEAWDAMRGYCFMDMDLKSAIQIATDVIACNLSASDVYTLDGYQDSSKMYEEFYLDEAGVARLVNELF